MERICIYVLSSLCQEEDGRVRLVVVRKAVTLEFPIEARAVGWCAGSSEDSKVSA